MNWRPDHFFDHFVFFLCRTHSQAQMKVKINWTAVTGAQSRIFMAKEERLLNKKGLELELIQIGARLRGQLPRS